MENSPFVEQLYLALPNDISVVIGNFITELQMQPQRGLMSSSLLVSIYSASNGFRAVMRGVNKAHGYDDRRSFIKKIILCITLMLIFTLSILTMLMLWIFSSSIIVALQYFLPFYPGRVIWITTAVIALAVLIGATSWMFRLACAKYGENKSMPWSKILPGACVTVLLWAISSNIFGLFMSRFSNISVIYGSIAGLFILIIWLNLISFFLLFGNTINALLKEN